MANEPTPAPSAGPVQQAASDAKVPRLTAKQLECLTLLSDGRVRKATTQTNPATDEVNGTTAGSMVAYGYVEGQQVPGKTLYKITPKGLEFLRSYNDKRQVLQAKREAAAKQPA
jgi:hypothetical protein